MHKQVDKYDVVLDKNSHKYSLKVAHRNNQH